MPLGTEPVGKTVVTVGLDDTQLKQGLTNLNAQMKLADNTWKSSLSTFKQSDRSIEKLATSVEGMNKKLEIQSKIVDAHQEKVSKLTAEYGANHTKVIKANAELVKQQGVYGNLKRSISEMTDEMKQSSVEQKKVEGQQAKLLKQEQEMARSKATLQDKMKLVDAEWQNNLSKMKLAGNQYGQLEGKIKSLNDKMELQKKAVYAQAAEVRKLTKEYGENSEKAVKANTELKNQTRIMNELKGDIAATTKELQDFNKAEAIKNSPFTQRQKELESYSSKLKSVGDKWTSTGQSMSLAVTAPLAGIGAMGVKTAMDFDAQMSRVGAISDTTGAKFEEMKRVAMELGASTTKSASEVAKGMEEMAAKGYDANQIMAAMPGIISAAEASGSDMTQTANVMASAMNAFGIEAGKSSHVADVLAQTANQSAADITDMEYALKYAAAPAKSLGMSLEETSASIGMMVDSGLKGEQAGTTLRGALLGLLDPSEKNAKLMNKMGVEVSDASGNFVGMEQLVRNLESSMEGMTDTQKAANLSQLVGKEAVSGMLVMMEQGPDKIGKMTKSLEESDGASQKASKAMMNNLKGAVEEMGGAFETVGIQIGQDMTPYIRELANGAQSLANKFSELPDWGRKVAVGIGVLAAATAPVIVSVGLVAKVAGSAADGLARLSGKYAVNTVAAEANAAANLAAGKSLDTGGKLNKGLNASSGGFLTFSKRAITAGRSASTLSRAGGLLSRGLGLIGGPVGIAVTAALTAIGIGFKYAYDHVSWFKKGIDNTGWVLKNLAGEWVRGTKMIAGTVSNWGPVKKVVEGLGVAADYAKEGFDKFKNVLAAPFKLWWDGLEEGFTWFNNIVKKSDGNWSQFKTNFANASKEWAVNTLEDIKTGFNNAVQGSKEWLSDTGQKMQEGLAKGQEAVKTWAQNFGPKFQTWLSSSKASIAKWGQDTAGKISAGLQTGQSKVKKWAEDFGPKFHTWLSSSKASIAKWGQDTAGKISAGLQTGQSKVKKWAEDFGPKFQTWLSSSKASIAKWGQETSGRIASGMESGKKTIKQWAEDTGSKIGGWLSTSKKSITDWGAKLPDQIKTAYTNAKNAVTQWAETQSKENAKFYMPILKGIIDDIKNFPSKINAYKESFKNNMSNFFSGVFAGNKEDGGPLKSWTSGVGKWLSNIPTLFGQKKTTAKTAANNFFSGAFAGNKEGGGPLKSWTSGLGKWLSNIPKLLDQKKQAAKTAANNFFSGAFAGNKEGGGPLKSWTSGLGKWLSNIPKLLDQKKQAAKTAVSNFFVNAGQGITGEGKGMSSWGKRIKNWFTGLPGRIQSSFDTIKGNVSKTISGIFNPSQRDMDAASAKFGSKAKSAITKPFSSKENKKDFSDKLGKMIVDGVGYALGFAAVALLATGREIIKRMAKGMNTSVEDSLLGGPLKKFFEWVPRKFKELVSPASKSAQSMWKGVTGWFNETKKDGMKSVGDLYTSTKDKFIDSKDSAISNAKGMWKGVTGWFNETKKDGMKSVGDLYTSTKDKFIDSKDSAISSAKGMWKGATGWLSKTKTDGSKAVGDFYIKTRDKFKDARNSAVANSKSLWKGVSGWYEDTRKNVKSKAEKIYGSTKENFRLASIYAVGKSKDMWKGVTGWFGNLRDDGIRIFETARGKVVGKFEDMYNGAKKWIDNIGTFISGSVTGLKNKASSLGKSVANGAISGLNKMIGGINTISKAITKKDLMDKIPELHTGTRASSAIVRNGAIARPTLAIVGDKGSGNGPGGYRREIIEKANGTKYLTPAKDTLVRLDKGDKVHSGRKTHAYMSRLPHFDKGTDKDDFWTNAKQFDIRGMAGNAMDGIGTLGKKFKETVGAVKAKAGDIIGDVMDYIKNPKALLDKVMGSMGIDFGGLGMTGTMAKLAYSKLKIMLQGKIKEWFESAGGGYNPYAAWTKTPGRGWAPGGHAGIDYAMPAGTPIPSPITGEVIQSWFSPNKPSGGNEIQIYADGFTHILMHMLEGSRKVQKGDRVTAGQIVGKVGNTGNSFGDHLHWQVNKGRGYLYNEDSIDPEVWARKYAKGSGGSGSGNWASKIRQAAAQMKQTVTDSDVSAIVAQINRESGGRESIVQSSSLRDGNYGANKARGLLQYVPSTFANYAVKGYDNINNGYHQLLAFFNNSNWRRDNPGGRSGWGPSGMRRFANGGIIQNETVIAGEEYPEMIIPLDPRKKHRARPLLAQANNIVNDDKFIKLSSGTTKAKSTRTHNIVWGDTLWDLARTFGTTVKELKRVNGLTSDMIYAGRKLLVPVKSAVKSTSKSSAVKRPQTTRVTNRAGILRGISNNLMRRSRTTNYSGLVKSYSDIGSLMSAGLKNIYKDSPETMLKNIQAVRAKVNSIIKADQAKIAANYAKARKSKGNKKVIADVRAENKAIQSQIDYLNAVKRNEVLKSNVIENIVKKRSAISTQLAAKQGKYKTTLEEKASLNTSVRDAYKNYGGFGAASGNSTKDFISVMNYRYKRMLEFHNDLVRLRKLGLDPQILRELIEGGVENSYGKVKVLLRGGKSGIASINNMQRKINKLASDSGKSESGIIYDPSIISQAKQIKNLNNQKTGLAASSKKYMTGTKKVIPLPTAKKKQVANNATKAIVATAKRLNVVGKNDVYAQQLDRKIEQIKNDRNKSNDKVIADLQKELGKQSKNFDKIIDLMAKILDKNPNILMDGYKVSKQVDKHQATNAKTSARRKTSS
ncbi:phage tail tape measure protein [Macrococcus equipercicus]|uniref:lysostaphin n=1 Tax=Macrococcus equipercicus TaxID=69967 RepID=A0A9Q9BUI1_9STAP|nr:phage tail tape measure protein [Macrococcus equipercicus]UTH13292.1 phage tail tape measure protein [Macrococcus equipercicus]